ncbi:MAG: redox-regulated ATPase YchF [Chloroflexi bacterium CG07_land_8_20_14_0_80_45_17]|nr:MAG: redox-regulated ATPase YchF [Chloroflexi bacterium CG07_land_8_20_14_0_80_45_17]
MKVAIIGLPKSGKTTIFNALTKGKAEVAAYSSSLTPNIGVAKVPDSRLSALENIFHPKKTVPAEVSYADIAGSPKAFSSKEEIGGGLLSYLTTADALLQVVRAFEDGKIPHPEGSVDPERDIATLDLELAFSDLAIIAKRLDRLEATLKGAKASERGLYLNERLLLQKIKTALEKDMPIREQGLAKDELKMLSDYQFLTAKPMLVVLNIGEEQIPRASQLEAEIKSLYPQFAVVALCGKLEMELGQLSNAEAEEFREAMGLTTPALDWVINLSYRLLGLISFFTTASAELKAWTIPRGITAPKAAGKVHSDMERGFIRAEVISYSDLERCGNLAEVRKRGLLKMEGKNYVVQDGDVITFLFNV